MSDSDRRAAERAIKTGLVTPEEVVEWVGFLSLKAALTPGMALRFRLCPRCKAGKAFSSVANPELCWCCCKGGHLDTCPTCSPLYAAGVRRGE